MLLVPHLSSSLGDYLYIIGKEIKGKKATQLLKEKRREQIRENKDFSAERKRYHQKK